MGAPVERRVSGHGHPSVHGRVPRPSLVRPSSVRRPSRARLAPRAGGHNRTVVLWTRHGHSVDNPVRGGGEATRHGGGPRSGRGRTDVVRGRRGTEHGLPKAHMLRCERPIAPLHVVVFGLTATPWRRTVDGSPRRRTTPGTARNAAASHGTGSRPGAAQERSDGRSRSYASPHLRDREIANRTEPHARRSRPAWHPGRRDAREDAPIRAAGSNDVVPPSAGTEENGRNGPGSRGCPGHG